MFVRKEKREKERVREERVREREGGREERNPDVSAAEMQMFFVVFFFYFYFLLVFPGDSDGKECTCNVGDPGSIPG